MRIKVTVRISRLLRVLQATQKLNPRMVAQPRRHLRLRMVVPPVRNNSTSLANTGPGDTIGIFVAVTVLGTFGHYLYTKRRLRLSE